jgi:hypothetical protein
MQAGSVSTAWGDDFGEVNSAADGVLGNLFAAAEAVGDEDSFGRCGPDGGQENPFTEGLGDGEFIAFETERASHAAAAGVQQLYVGTGAAEDRDFVCHLHHGFVVAMAVEDDLVTEMLRWLEIVDVAREKFAEEQGLVIEALGAGFVGKEIDEFVAEDAGAAGFEENEGEASVDLRGEIAENLFEIAFCGGEEAKVI